MMPLGHLVPVPGKTAFWTLRSTPRLETALKYQ
jgi:hypothetical protein